MLRRILVCMLAVTVASVPALTQQKKQAKNDHPAVLWQDPGNIPARDLFYGPGGKDGQPQPPFQFDKENLGGNSPKFDVHDARGEKWSVKVGFEARPETVATRLMWAVGYTANENYFVNDVRAQGMPPNLTRGAEYTDKAGEIFQARLQRKPGKDHKPWSWQANPFTGTREFNGLRVMMALLNNWDLKDDNNARYIDKDTGREIYYVSDLGASFGSTGKSYSDESSRNNIEAYAHSKFISKVTPTYVSFNFPTHPAFYHIFNVPYFVHQMHNRWVGRQIPLKDVRWIASLLTQLTPGQIRDAFRAAGYNPQQIDAFTAAVQARIGMIAKL